jgi:hypothetical protein
MTRSDILASRSDPTCPQLLLALASVSSGLTSRSRGGESSPRCETNLSVGDRVAPSLAFPRPVGPQRARRTGWPIGQTTSMRTISAHDDQTTSAASRRCLRSCMLEADDSKGLRYVPNSSRVRYVQGERPRPPSGPQDRQRRAATTAR